MFKPFESGFKCYRIVVVFCIATVINDTGYLSICFSVSYLILYLTRKKEYLWNLHTQFIIYDSYMTVRYKPEEFYILLQRYLLTQVYCCSIHSSQDNQNINILNNGYWKWTHSAVKNKEMLMNGDRKHYSKWSNTDPGRHTLDIFSHMWMPNFEPLHMWFLFGIPIGSKLVRSHIRGGSFKVAEIECCPIEERGIGKIKWSGDEKARCHRKYEKW